MRRFAFAGLVSLVWLLLRSGMRPTRLAYPCQQVAAANVWHVLVYAIPLLISVFTFKWLKKRRAMLVLGSGVTIVAVIILVLRNDNTLPVQSASRLSAWTSPNASSDVFVVEDVPVPVHSLDGGAVPGGVSPGEALQDAGVDALTTLMSSHGIHLHKTAGQPDGLISPNDVVVLKINDQWNGQPDRSRSHTNNDVLKGLIYRIMQHPEGFTGAVIVGENSQWSDPNWDSPDYNNAQDSRQSYRDVVDAFVSQSYDVCISDWSEFWCDFVGEFSDGDTGDGYVLIDEAGEPGTDQISYPKFTLTCGSKPLSVSMRHGIWNGSSYDNARLKMINLPVLKRHWEAGATVSVKNYLGFLTTCDRDRRFGGYDEMHGFFWGYGGTHSDYGLIARQMARIRRAELNLVDAIWVNLEGNQRCDPDGCVRRNVLLASTDPIAVDYYASVHVLSPLIPGYVEGNAARHNSRFRTLLMNTENRLRLEGIDDTIDLDDSYDQEQEEAQFNVHVSGVYSVSHVYMPILVKDYVRG